MGNCCSGAKEESKKTAAFQTADDGDHVGFPVADSSLSGLDGLGGGDNNAQPPQQAPQQAQQQQEQQQRNVKALREEQNRLDLIVQMAGRGMVSVRSTRGSTGYYDQGFAAALGQHLEQTTTFPDQLPIRLPSSASTSDNKSVLQRLSQPQWDNIALGKKKLGLAGCGGENPNTYMDHIAGSFLDSVVPKKERIFAGGVGPMVENLL
ncbi:expressed unknown protein [Seminavis robusta]|uniref:Uncharacterized protein n=1 Tax=Seminavis robusta TaxID=568900 RepID=A0A9N8EGK0_9STRA|nr:expressed unknown protein [Seminavis robusta]|eukprot:Sro968_g226090.1 n/a (207) ;mRNA; r:35589-36209